MKRENFRSLSLKSILNEFCYSRKRASEGSPTGSLIFSKMFSSFFFHKPRTGARPATRGALPPPEVPGPRRGAPRRRRGRVVAALRGIGQTLQGSFSAVSKPTFASKYAFESSRRDLHKALLCTALKSLKKNAGIFPKFAENF